MINDSAAGLVTNSTRSNNRRAFYTPTVYYHGNVRRSMPHLISAVGPCRKPDLSPRRHINHKYQFEIDPKSKFNANYITCIQTNSLVQL